jgi:hypothetical protein
VGVAFAATREDSKICTLIGGITGVTVDLAPEHRPDAGRVTVCAGGDCRRLRRGAVAIHFPVQADGPRRVSLTVIAEHPGEPTEVSSGVVRLERSEPNGPGCGTWWNTEVRSDALRPATGDRSGQVLG